MSPLWLHGGKVQSGSSLQPCRKSDDVPSHSFDYVFFHALSSRSMARCSEKKLAQRDSLHFNPRMFSHVVIFWTDPENPKSADELLAGMEKFLKPIPGVLQFHAGRMVGSPRPVVEQSYQVALNLIFADKKAQDDYQVHPLHVEFVEKVFKKTCQKVVIYDFE